MSPQNAKAPKEPCEVCHKPISVKWIGTHLRNAHGVYGGISGRRHRARLEENNGRAGKGKTMTPVPAPVAGPDTVDPDRLAEAIAVGRGAWRELLSKEPNFTVAPFIVLEDSEGGIWLAERIR